MAIIQLYLRKIQSREYQHTLPYFKLFSNAHSDSWARYLSLNFKKGELIENVTRQELQSSAISGSDFVTKIVSAQILNHKCDSYPSDDHVENNKT